MKPPRHPQTVKSELDDLVASLIERAIVDDQNFPILRQLSTDGWEVSFGGAEFVSLAMGDIDYRDTYQELSDKRSYNVKMIDGGLLQIMYLFKNDRLIRHRLAYYPSPSLRPFQEEPDAYLRDELFLDIVSRRIVPFPLRFDFDEAAAEDVSHPSCHLTLGDARSCRIPVSAPLSPRWFIEFILRNFYQTDRHDLIGGLPSHRLSFPATLTRGESRLMHMVVPKAEGTITRLLGERRYQAAASGRR